MSRTAQKIKNEIVSKQERSHETILPDRNARVAELAYFKAQNRSFEPGHELDDWLEAEQEFDREDQQVGENLFFIKGSSLF
jgi:Protein of unknown function (DUF2934)